MKIIRPDVEIIDCNHVMRTIEVAGRVCYKSEDKIGEDTSNRFIRNLILSGHESVLEHGVITARFICDRGVSHEIVRHRIASYSQESTRYCNYSKDKFDNEVTFIMPCYLERGTPTYFYWEDACVVCEKAYFDMLAEGCSPQEARAVLPNSLKTEIVITMNAREWRHFFKLRTAADAHPQMREIAGIARNIFMDWWPVLFTGVGGAR